MLGKSSANSAGLLGSEVERGVSGFVRSCSQRSKPRLGQENALLSLVEESELRPLVGVYDSENASNALANIVDAGELGGASSDLAGPELDQFPSIRQHSIEPAFCHLHSGDARLKLLQLSAQLILVLTPQLGGLLWWL